MKLNELGIHIEFNEDDMLKARAIIMGPKDTPYENGILYFIIEFPNNYPFSPPKIGYLSSSRHRIHPNLYVGSHKSGFGKVCLSILGTWSGPGWTTIMDISTVLLSIQSLLDNDLVDNYPHSLHRSPCFVIPHNNPSHVEQYTGLDAVHITRLCSRWG